MLYTVLHVFTQLLFWAGNQGNHQNFDPSGLAIQEPLTDFHGDEAKKIKWPKWPTQKKN